MKTILAAGRGTQILVAVLAVQLLLAAVLYWQSASTAQFAAADALFTLDQASVDSILISDGEQELKLVNGEQGWRIDPAPGTDRQLPADEVRISTTLENLATLSAGLPVATTELAQDQLEVAEDNFQRRIKLSSADQQLMDILLGTSPGFRKAHMRKAGEQAIHAAKINVHDLPLSADEWLDKSLLAAVSVTQLSAEGFSLQKTDGIWSVSEPAELPAGRILDQEKVDSLISQLENLRVSGLGEQLTLDNTEPGTATAVAADNSGDNAKPVLLELKLAVGSEAQQSGYTFHQLDTKATVSRDDVEGVFNIASAEFDKLNAIDFNSLLKASEDQTPASNE